MCHGAPHDVTTIWSKAQVKGYVLITYFVAMRLKELLNGYNVKGVTLLSWCQRCYFIAVMSKVIFHLLVNRV